MTEELKPCPFCGGKASFERIGDRRQSTIVACEMCGCRHESGEEWDHGTAWNTRAHVRVKPLVWEDFDGRGAKASAFYSANYLINLWRGRGQFEVSFSYPGHQTGYDGERWHDTLEAAKAAAQADYERRILAAIAQEGEGCPPRAS